jgi:arylsulfatase A-like enzyme
LVNNTTPQRKSLETNEQALKWLSSNYESPFFMWVHFYDAHQPYDTYCDSSYSLGKSPDNPVFNDGVVGYDSPTPTTKDYDFLISRYNEEIKCQDRQLGLLIDKLKDLKIYDETDIIVASDHGENFDHGSVFHGQNLYEGSLRIPLIVKMNDTTGQDGTPVSLTDIYPTVVEEFSLTENFVSDGVSLLNPKILSRKNIFFETTTMISNYEYTKKNAILSNQLKLIADSENNVINNYEAYDIGDDKAELNNIWYKETSSLNALLVDLLNFYK